jgi:hypothetical protein
MWATVLLVVLMAAAITYLIWFFRRSRQLGEPIVENPHVLRKEEQEGENGEELAP